MSRDADLGYLLGEVRRALVAGDLDALPALGAALEEAGVAPLADAKMLSALREAAARNLVLLSAARRGVTAARRRLEEIAGLASPVSYDARGRRADLPAPPSGRFRRA